MAKFKLTKLTDPRLPKPVLEALVRVVKLVPKIQRKYLSNQSTKEDVEDCLSSFLVLALDSLQKKMKKLPTEIDWFKYFVGLLKSAIIEHSKYIYFPLEIPKTIRLGMKKYIEVVGILRKYKDWRVLYNNIVLHTCNLECKDCSNQCRLSNKDHHKLRQLLYGAEHSLTRYAQLYRKTLLEFILILEEVHMFKSNFLTPDVAVSYDFEEQLDLHTLKERFSNVHPQLFQIYCESLEEADVDFTVSPFQLSIPNGWTSKDIKDRYGLTTQQFKDLLNEGNNLINAVRPKHGGLLGEVPTESAGE